jgi:predicted heme/steroid binding protein
MRRYTRAELARADGKEGRPAWIAYRGKVYDVSASFLWKGGRHMATHEAGRDLTAALVQAPHGGNLLERVPVIGSLEEEAAGAGTA